MSVASDQDLWTPTVEQSTSSRLQQFLDAIGVAGLDECNVLARSDPERFWSAAASSPRG